MNAFSLDLVNQATVHLFLGFGLALVNVVLRYFFPSVPRAIRVLGWRKQSAAFVAAYLIFLVIQLATSPLYRSLLHSVYTELAWSPYQALFNMLGVVLMDLIVIAWTGVRRGAEVSGQKLAEAREQVAEFGGDLQERVSGALTPEEREDLAAKRTAEAESAAATSAERQKRLDEKLKDY
jgi:hypothetical protein